MTIVKIDISSRNIRILPLFAAWLARVPRRISHSHSSSNPQERLRHLVKRALVPFAKWFTTDLLACSKFAGEFQFGKQAVNVGRVTILKNAIDFERYRFNADERVTVRKEFGLCDQLVIGCVGRFVTQKNPLFAIKVFAEVAKRRPDAVLLMIGEGPLRPEIERAIADVGLKDRVILAGQRSDPWRYYNAFDVFLSTSLYEGLPLVAIEAQVNGLKCVMSSEVSRETDITGRVEFLGLDEDIDHWAQSLTTDLSLENDREKDSACMSAKARDAGYDIKLAASRLAALYSGEL